MDRIRWYMNEEREEAVSLVKPDTIIGLSENEVRKAFIRSTFAKRIGTWEIPMIVYYLRSQAKDFRGDDASSLENIEPVNLTRLADIYDALASRIEVLTNTTRNTAEAHWEGLAHGVFQCSSCRNSISVGTPFIDEETAQRWLSMYRYCPHCGAKMGKEQNK